LGSLWAEMQQSQTEKDKSMKKLGKSEEEEW